MFISSYSKKTILFLIILLMINIFTQKTIFTKKQVSTASNNGGKIFVTVDNNLLQVTVDGNNVPLSGAVKGWKQTKVLSANILPGSTISITGSNTGAFSSLNPAGIIATIIYTNESGVSTKINTGSNWVCDDKPAAALGANSENTFWRKLKGSPIANIEASAQWIWNPSNPAKSTCTYTVPGPEVIQETKKPSGTIYVTVDNNLVEVKVDDKSLPLSGNVGDWTQTKTIPADISPGSVISITGTNSGNFSSGNPAGILATIVYSNKEGTQLKINTGTNWSCDNKPANAQGANSGSTIWMGVKGSPIANIDPTAQWIWNPSNPAKSTCTFTVPQETLEPEPEDPKKPLGTIYVTVDNILNEVKINGKNINLSGEVNDWRQAKTLKAELSPGDIISITGTNEGAYSSGNPAGILASILYENEQGKQVKLDTSADWTCDDKPANILGANQGETIWMKVRGSAIPDIYSTAQWIWNPSNPQKSTCYITIPTGPIISKKCLRHG